MTVSQIISLLNRQNPDWDTQPLIDLLNSFVQMALKVDTQENVVYDSNTGDLPYLATTAGLFLYTMPPNYYKIWDIVTCSTSQYPNNAYYAHQEQNGFVTPKKPITLANKSYLPVPTVKTQAYGALGVATVMFRFDPKTSINTYQIYGCASSGDILTITSVLSIPDKLHLGVVIPAMQLMIDGLDNGRYVENLQVINDTLLPKIWQEMNYNTMDDFAVDSMGI